MVGHEYDNVWQYSINEWYYENPCTEIELFQSEGYFNYKYMDSGRGCAISYFDRLAFLD